MNPIIAISDVFLSFFGDSPSEKIQAASFAFSLIVLGFGGLALSVAMAWIIEKVKKT